MDRRSFLQNLAPAAAAVKTSAPVTAAGQAMTSNRAGGATPVDIDGHTLICELEQGGQRWKVYEDLRSREGTITFLSSMGAARIMTKSAEATFAEEGPQHLGLSMDEVGLSGPDLGLPTVTAFPSISATDLSINQHNSFDCAPP